MLLLKKILHIHGLNQPYSGGLNSYSLVVMATTFLKQFGVKDSISKNLREFLNFYGSFFDPKTNVIVDEHI